MPPKKKTPTKATGKCPDQTPLPVEALRWRCDPESLPFDSTAEVEPVTSVVGQDAAVEALRFGLETSAPGQNVFVRGPSGTGRLTLTRRLLKEIRPAGSRVKDCCYVRNFSGPERPRLITLPAGTGRRFRTRVGRLADFVRDELPSALSTEGVKARKAALERTAEKQLEEVLQPFKKALKSAGLSLVSLQDGSAVSVAIFPLVEGDPIPPEEFEQLHDDGEVTDEQYSAVRRSYEEFEKQLSEVNERASEVRRDLSEAVGKLLEGAARSAIKQWVRGIEDTFPEPGVRTFLEGLVDDVVKHGIRGPKPEADFTRPYHVNAVLQHADDSEVPIIIENNPTMRNLLGTIDVGLADGDDARPSHLGIRAGSLLRADGGYLILEDREICKDAAAWEVLMRTLRTGRLEITPPETTLPGWAPGLKPDPIEINVKVVIIGSGETYALLDENDADFPHLFKVLADFDSVIPRDEAGVNQYAAVLARVAREEHLPPFDRTAMAALTEHGARIAARSGKLTARFGRLADIAREAAYIAGKEGRRQVTGADVTEAVRRGKRRANLPSRQFRELVADGLIRVETEGSVVGQVNGLAVLQAGPMVYGFPKRITATIGPGSEGVINIEREAELSGAIHTKGFYILGGLLRFLLRTDHPLAFDASIAFEQSYGGIDGDSASGAEACSLLSALTDIPLRQDLAMTGAIDQMGHILAVGSVNEKVEGFFDACRDLGVSGTQGVIIPQANSGDLMLREDVVEACGAGGFRVYAVETVHEAIEVLTGIRAGRRNAQGAYPRNSVLGKAVQRAREYWLMSYGPDSRL